MALPRRSPTPTPESASLDDDATLVARMCRGDESAFDAIVRRHAAALVTYAGVVTRSTDVAEEVVQDVLFEFWRRRDRLAITTTLRTYLYGAVRNRALNAAQRIRRRERLLETVVRDSATSADDDRPSDAETRLRADEIDAAVRRAIDRLPARCRTAYAYRWYDGLTYPEIADRMGTAVKTVEAQVMQALKFLRKRLARMR